MMSPVNGFDLRVQTQDGHVDVGDSNMPGRLRLMITENGDLGDSAITLLTKSQARELRDRIDTFINQTR